MDFIQSILNNSETSSDPLNFLGILATVMVSIYIFRSEISVSFIKERHEKLYFPLFDTLEPILFQDIKPELLSKALDIIQSNKQLADGKLINLHYCCSEQPSQQNFISLCSYADKAYDKSCRKLKLRTRPLEYRLNRRQFKNKAFLAMYFGLYALKFFLAFIALAFVFMFVLSFFYYFYSISNDLTKIIFLFLVSLGSLAILKFFEKHY